ncbi:GntR family transcriptional regulator [Actinomyces sp.]|uniref:GntR family transcriptional regulator n=1 Tax=Actinomyces sp. TaxID=29317 RepID=UPI00289A7C8A|nr:GntR family transcriptional regulator [Actinomyces sp.]
MDVDDARPIWVQLVVEFRRRISTGQWAPGSRIPSVRELALEMGVNPNTVQRALGELDRESLTLTERTAGRFVTQDRSAIDAAREALAATTTDTYIDSVAGIGLGLEDATRLLALRWAAKEENQ